MERSRARCAQNKALVRWIPFGVVRNPLLMPPAFHTTEAGFVAAFERLRLGSTSATRYAPIIPSTISLERMVAATQVVAECEVEHGVLPLSQDDSFAIHVPDGDRRVARTALGASQTLPRPKLDVPSPVRMAQTAYVAPREGLTPKQRRRAAAMQRRRDLRIARERRNRFVLRLGVRHNRYSRPSRRPQAQEHTDVIIEACGHTPGAHGCTPGQVRGCAACRPYQVPEVVARQAEEA